MIQSHLKDTIAHALPFTWISNAQTSNSRKDPLLRNEIAKIFKPIRERASSRLRKINPDGCFRLRHAKQV
jgi:hypothetical protein